MIMSIVMAISVLAGMPTMKVEAASQENVVSQLNSLMSQYVGRTATSSQMYMGSQCKGFANWVFLKVFGVYIGPYPDNANYTVNSSTAKCLGTIMPGNMSAANAKNLFSQAAPGDYIQVQRSYKNSSGSYGAHSMIAVSTDSSGITVFDCNSDGKNTIKKYTISWSTFASKNRGASLYRCNGYTPSKAAVSKPTNVTLSKNQYWYDIKDTITLSPSANNATDYWICIKKDGNTVANFKMNGAYSFAANKWGYGDYYAWISACNSAGSTDSSGITFSVVKAPGYKGVSTAKKRYSIDETVNINVSTVCAKGQVIGIDRYTQRVLTQDVPANYSISASKLGVGDYSAYFSVYNGSGTVDTSRVHFSIYNSKPKTSSVSMNKTSFAKGEKVTFTFKSDTATNYSLGIDNTSGRIQTYDTTNESYTRTFDKCGDYSCYVTSWNKYGYKDSARIQFTVGGHQYTSKVEKAATCTTAGVRRYTCTSCKKTYTEAIPKTGHSYTTKVVAPTCKEKGYTLHTCSKCKNSYCDNNTNVTSTHTYGAWTVTKAANCKTEGAKSRKCTVCKKTETVSVPKTAHNYLAKEVAATAKEQGYTLYTCSACGDSYKVVSDIPYEDKTDDTNDDPKEPDDETEEEDTVEEDYEEVQEYTDISECSVTKLKSSYAYTGKKITPKLIVKDGQNRLEKNEDYTIVYKNNKACGKATVVITGKGDYKGTLVKTFRIVPKKSVLSSVKHSGTGKIKISWKKDKQASGYEVLVSTNKKFKGGKKKIIIAKNQITAKTVKNLKADKTYYVKMRAYKVIDGKKYYGAYSKVKTVINK